MTAWRSAADRKAPRLSRGAVKSLDLALFVDGKHNGVRRRIDIEPDDLAQLVDACGRLARGESVGNRCRIQMLDAIH
jgi:hypothetical protein